MHAAEAREEDRRVARVPRLAPGCELASLPLSPAEGFLLSRIDGYTDWSVLREIGGLPPDEAERCLARWLDDGIVLIGPEEPVGANSPAAPAHKGIDESALDDSLDISLELQRGILEVEASLPSSYHALLGVDRDADNKAIKRAYFALSKRYHPDRYFRREIGDYRERLTRIFKHLVEAYELLSDPATRAEIERSLGPVPEEPSEPPKPSGEPVAPVPAPDPRRATLERLRRHLRIPPKILTERRIKARQFYDAAQVAMHRKRWSEAAATIKLAIAFDPWTDEYKSAFAEVQGSVHRIRAAELLESAQASWDDRDKQEALRLFEEAVHYQPGDASAHAGVARAALRLGELDKAREAAEAACELEPEVSDHLRVLARIHGTAGRRTEALEALEAALRLAPADREIKQEIMELRRHPARRDSGGPR